MWLFDLPARFLAIALASQRLLDSFLLSRLQVEGVTFDFFDDVLLLYLTFEPSKGVLQSLALLKSYFSQTGKTPPNCTEDFHAPARKVLIS
jgi:hypothetical protein